MDDALRTGQLEGPHSSGLVRTVPCTRVCRLQEGLQMATVTVVHFQVGIYTTAPP